MGVRVRVRIEGPDGRVLDSVALLNGGFETRDPHVLLPAEAARKLFAHPMKGKKVAARTADHEATMTRPADPLVVRVLSDDREGPAVTCRALVAPHAEEVLLSDSAIDAVGVEIRSFGGGLWQFVGESRTRRSEEPETW